MDLSSNLAVDTRKQLRFRLHCLDNEIAERPIYRTLDRTSDCVNECMSHTPIVLAKRTLPCVDELVSATDMIWSRPICRGQKVARGRACSGGSGECIIAADQMFSTERSEQALSYPGENSP